MRSVLAFDSRRDLALLAIDSDLAPLPLSRQHQFRSGEDIVVIGNPGGLPGQTLVNAVSHGVMSAQTEKNGKNWYGMSISINRGNSGGPVLDKRGEVVGVVSWKIVGQGTEGLAFSVPVGRK